MQSALDPRGPQAARLASLWQVMLIGGTVIFVVVFSLALLATLRRPSPENSYHEHDVRRVMGVALGAGLTILTLLGLLVCNVLVSRAITEVPGDPLKVQVVAHRWWWEIVYPAEPSSRSVRTANELHMPVGRPVEISLESRDVIHSFWVPSLHGKQDAIPGRKNAFWLQADQPGMFRGQCSEFCGLQHAKMALFVVAETEQAFARWLEHQSRSASPPRDELALKGEGVFLSGPCSMCHTIRGTHAMASVGPDLTHLASRKSLASGTLINAPGQLAGWILDPQHVKRGSFMPASDLEPDRLHALLHFLESLK